jgi:hypothetical protein
MHKSRGYSANSYDGRLAPLDLYRRDSNRLRLEDCFWFIYVVPLEMMLVLRWALKD